jgi:hypothetical protein
MGLGLGQYLWNAVALQLIDVRGRDRADDSVDEGGRGDSERRGGDGDRLLENARILAALNIAMADAAIGCWDQKLKYNFWRPITAIRESDPTWTPLFATPAHQDYPSGHSCISGAATAILADEFGERTSFTLRSDVLVGVPRTFRSFSEALEDVKDARVFAGIHFRTACDDGTALGKAVAQYVLDNAFHGRP